MAGEIDLRSPGALAPVAPSPVAPLSPTGNNNLLPIDYINGRQVSPPSRQQQQPQSPQVSSFFGEPLPQGTTQAHVEQMLGQLSALYQGDFSRLGHSQRSINASIAFLCASYGEPIQPEIKRHSYNLHQLTGDVLAENWANQVSRVGATQKFVSDTIWYLHELQRRIDAQKLDAPAREGASNFGSPEPDNYTDAQWQQIVRANERAALNTEVALKKKWGASYHTNVNLANSYLASLPPAQQKKLSSLTAGGVSGLNTVEVIEGLFQSAIGGGTLPKNGAGIAGEIHQIEEVIRTNRKAYNRDMQMQQRLLELYRLRGD